MQMWKSSTVHAHRYMHPHRCTHTQMHTQRHTHTNSHTDAYIHTDKCIQQIHRETHTNSHTERHTNIYPVLTLYSALEKIQKWIKHSKMFQKLTNGILMSIYGNRKLIPYHYTL